MKIERTFNENSNIKLDDIITSLIKEKIQTSLKDYYDSLLSDDLNNDFNGGKISC